MAFAVIVVQNLCLRLRRHPTIVLRHRFQNPKTPTPPSSLSAPRTLIIQPRNLASSARSSDKTLVFTKDERFGAWVTGGSRPEEDAGTIAAIVTSVGGPSAAVGIVRLSGSLAVEVASRVFRPTRKPSEGECLWKPRSHFVEYGFALDKQDNVIDEVLAIPMLAPRSYTKEDVVELQCHGNDLCLRRVLRACLEAGAKLAEPG
ncbi:putative tRNA modification GTPase mnmE [Platanthera guangdongensis]|uniref:tRNA modification GTPase mnmE n=1 Tax=Platanthera guangdongensis TaxID=2320717 RepID=A0ABR2LS83_9ASPA